VLGRPAHVEPAPSSAPELSIRLWDPSTQLRFAAKRTVPQRPDGAPNQGRGRTAS
jgi:hypothetical protein